MATQMKVEELELTDYLGHDDFMSAMDAFLKDQAQPIKWNDWQKLGYAVAKEFPET